MATRTIDDWFDAAPTPYIDCYSKQHKNIDKELKRFIADTAILMKPFIKLEPVDRVHLHQRCQQLGLTSQSDKYKYMKHIKNVVVTKPPGWSFDANREPNPIQQRDYIDYKK